MIGAPLVTVVIPTFNKAQYLTEAVESIVAQTHSNIEIIIVNDGSTDDSSAVAKRLIAQHASRPISLVEQENKGISSARNSGLSRAKGEFLLSLDGDDRIAPTYVEKAVRIMREQPIQLVCCDVQLFGSESGDWIPSSYDPYFLRYDNCIPTAAVYHRSVFEKTGGFKVAVPFAEDWEFFINASRGGLGVYTIREKLYFYRRTESGLLGTYLKDRWTEPASLMMLVNSDLYNIEDLRFAQEGVLKGGERWEAAFLKQETRFPQEWLPKLILGIFAESRREFERALALYSAAAQLTQLKNWLPLYRIALLLEQLGKSKESADLFHEVRILRPDMHFVVGPKIKAVWGELQERR